MKFSVVSLAIAVFALGAGSASAGQVQIDLSPYTTGNVTTYNMTNYGLPSAGQSFTVGGVSLKTSAYPANNDGTMAIVNGVDQPTTTITTNISGAKTVYAAVNSFYGQTASTPIGTITVTDKAGATESLNLTEGVNIRDYYFNVYNDTAPNVYGTYFTSGGSDSTGYQTSNRLDVVAISVAAFGSSPLTSITFSGENIVNGGYINGAPILEAVTVATSGVPELSTWAMMLLGFIGLAYAVKRRATRRALA